MDSATAPTNFTPAVNYVNVTAGSDVAKNDCTVLPCTGGFFAIQFDSVIFSGSQFRLYLSTNGFSQINTTAGQTSDLLFGPTFNVGSLYHAYAAVSGGYHIGNVTGNHVVEGPLPIQVSSVYQFIKIYDGSSSSVAASIKLVGILPGLTLTPSTGPAGTSVSASGGGFPVSLTIDLVYTYTLTYWDMSTVVKSGNWSTGVSTTAKGYFTKQLSMVNVMQQINPPEGVILSVDVSIQAKLEQYPHTSYGLPAIFNETSTFVTQFISLDSSGAHYDTSTAPYSFSSMYGTYNGSTGSGVTTFLTVDTVSGGKIIVAGNDSLVSGAVTFKVDGHLNKAKTGVVGGTQIGTTTASTSGHFNGTANLPSLPLGFHFVFVSIGGVVMWFQIYVEPSLILTPSEGPVGETILVTALGFPTTCLQPGVVSGCKISLYWGSYTTEDDTDYFLGNVTVGANGQFNQTFTFTVPHSYGGYHDVEALPMYCGPSNSESLDPCLEEVAEVSFTVTPTLIICKGTTCGDGSTDVKTVSVNANTRGLISAVGTGFEPSWIYVNIDGASYSDCETYISSNGDFNLNFTTAGFRPGLHQFETWSCSEGDLNGVPNGLAYFNVTTIGDYLSGGGSSIPPSTITEIHTIYTNVNTILGWQSIITGMDTHVSSILSGLTALTTTVNTIDTHVSSILSGLTALTTTVNTIDTHVSSIISTLAPLPAKVDTAAANALAASTAATNAKNSVSSTETYVLVVAVLAAITLVLELAILVRKLD